MGCSRSAVAIIYEELSKDGAAANQQRGDGKPRLSDAHEERSKPADEVLTAKEFDTDSDQAVLDH